MDCNSRVQHWLGADLFSIQDHSISETLPDKQHKSGTLNQILKASSHPDCKALDALDFPRSAPAAIDLRFATDFIGWDQVQGEIWCMDNYPTSAVRWGLCATAGAYHKVHFDCEGFGTFVYPESGVTIWMIGVPKQGKTFHDLARIDSFSKEFSLNEANSHLVDWFPLTLTSGTAL